MENAESNTVGGAELGAIECHPVGAIAGELRPAILLCLVVGDLLVLDLKGELTPVLQPLRDCRLGEQSGEKLGRPGLHSES